MSGCPDASDAPKSMYLLSDSTSGDGGSTEKLCGEYFRLSAAADRIDAIDNVMTIKYFIDLNVLLLLYQCNFYDASVILPVFNEFSFHFAFI